jgi:hypothetical protein
MNKRIREKLDTWDLKSVFLTVTFLAIAFFLFFFFFGIRERFRAKDKEKFKGQTKGEIIKVEKVERMSQGRWTGTKIYVDGYKVTYEFNVNGKIFQDIDVIPLNTANQKLLTQIIEQKNNTCIVKFDIADPNNSILVERK